MIQDDRIQILNKNQVHNRMYVLCWMQASQRAEWNHALEYAISRANERKKPVVVFLGLTDRYPEANARHYAFMLEGISEVVESLRDRGILMVVRSVSPEVGVVEMSKDADLVVVDRGYTSIQRAWRQHAAQHLDCPLIQVETDVVVPIEVTSDKEEWAAATIRRKIHRRLDRFLIPVEAYSPKYTSLDLGLESLDVTNPQKIRSDLHVNRDVTVVKSFQGGSSQARKRLDRFINEKLDRYDDLRNDPTLDYISHMSPYIHFGQISPLYIALHIMETGSPGEAAYLEELIVRRELSMNYVYFNTHYDAYDGLPDWAKRTLQDHANDVREYLYSRDEFEAAATHDPYWNAAQDEMKIQGKMHGYMRMYWGKKILEWSPTPREAFEITLYLNNKYELDGRDPNGFTGVAWCFGKHDRAWQERPVFGKVRYMNAKGLKRKFDADGYVDQIAALKR